MDNILKWSLTLEKPPSETRHSVPQTKAFRGRLWGVQETAARADKVGSGGSKEEKGQTRARSHGTNLPKKLPIWSLSLHETPASGISEASVLSRGRLLSTIWYRIKSYIPSAGSYCSKIKLLLKIQAPGWAHYRVLTLGFPPYTPPPPLFFKVIWRNCTKRVQKGRDESKQKFAKDFKLCLEWHEEMPGSHSSPLSTCPEAPVFRPGGAKRRSILLCEGETGKGRRLRACCAHSSTCSPGGLQGPWALLVNLVVTSDVHLSSFKWGSFSEDLNFLEGNLL